MSKFSLDDYVDVAERIAQFSARYPEGSLQSEIVYMTEPTGWLCIGHAYRTPDDPRPGVGHAFEPVPGKTPYTRDSEAQNAETAAWGRAIVALGFETKKIASKQEVKARHESGAGERKPAAGAGNRPVPVTLVSQKDMEEIDAAVDALAEIRGIKRDVVLKALENTMGKPASLYGDVEVTMAKARLKAWMEKAQEAA